MAYVITVGQTMQIQTLVNGVVKAKSLLPGNKYIISDAKNKQIVDLKKVSVLKIRPSSVKEESSCENLELK